MKQNDQDFSEVYEVALCNLDTLVSRIDQLNKRAEKLGVEGVSLDEVQREQRKNEDDGTYYTIVQVIVSGQRIRLDGGWYFVGVVEHTDIGNILRPAPGQMIPTQYRTGDRVCQHCNLDRKRKDTYIVANEAGDFMQVGRNCLLDFTGHADPHKYARWAEFMAEFSEFAESLADDEYIPSGRAAEGIGFFSYLECVAAAIRLWGWTSKGKARENEFLSSTAQDAESMHRHHGRLRDKQGHVIFTKDGRPAQTEPGDMGVAEAAVAWLDEIPEDKIEKSDYLWNLWVAVQDSKDGVVTWRRLGIVASLVGAYNREQAERREALAVARANGREPGHVGTVKVRRDFAGLEVVSVIEIDGHYGISYLHKFVDGEGNHLVWFKSTHPALEVGQTYCGKATVKGHSEYKGVPQTTITRANFDPEGVEEFCPFCSSTKVQALDAGKWNRSCLGCNRGYTKESVK